MVVIFIMLYGAWNRATYRRASDTVLASVDSKYTDALSTSITVTNKWLLGRMLSMVIVAVLTYLGLLLVGVSSPLFLAMIAGVLSFIPNLGPILSAIPAVLVAAGGGLEQVGLVLVLYTGIQFVESYFITPAIQKNLISVPPALLLAVQVIMASIFGILGLLLAAPITAIVIALGDKALHKSK